MSLFTAVCCKPRGMEGCFAALRVVYDPGVGYVERALTKAEWVKSSRNRSRHRHRRHLSIGMGHCRRRYLHRHRRPIRGDIGHDHVQKHSSYHMIALRQSPFDHMAFNI